MRAICGNCGWHVLEQFENERWLPRSSLICCSQICQMAQFVDWVEVLGAPSVLMSSALRRWSVVFGQRGITFPADSCQSNQIFRSLISILQSHSLDQHVDDHQLRCQKVPHRALGHFRSSHWYTSRVCCWELTYVL